MFKAGDHAYGDIFDWHCAWWKQRERENVFIVSFEELSEDPCPVLRKMAAFLGITSITDEEVEAIARSIQFDAMKTNPKTNFSKLNGIRYIGNYMRKGAVGDWKGYFTEEQNAYVDALYEEKCVPIGLKMKFEL